MLIDIKTVAEYLTREMMIPPGGTVPAAPETRIREWMAILEALAVKE